MSGLPEGRSSGKAWLGFSVVFIVLVLAYPELWGLLIGIGMFLVPAYMVSRAIGGSGGFFR
jgi:hypothetical protein